jgi:hypothetical protein
LVEGNPRAGGVEKFLFPLPPQDLGTLEEYLRDTYGTGAFRVRVRQRDLETGRDTLFRVWTTHVMAPPRRPWSTPVPQGVSDAPPAQAGGDLAQAITAAIHQQGETNAQLIRELFTRQTPAPATPLSEVCAMFETFQKMSAPPPAPVAAAPEASTALDLFMKGIDFANDRLGGAPAGDGDWKDVLRDVIRSPVVRAIGERLAAPVPPQPIDSSEVPAPEGAQRLRLNQSPAPRPAPPTAQLQTELAAGIVRDLMAYARAGVDPAATLDYVDEMLPGGMIRQLCNDSTIIDQLLLLVPEAAPHRGWFAALQQVVRAEYREPENANATAPPDSAPQPAAINGRDKGNTEDNALPNQGGGTG